MKDKLIEFLRKRDKLYILPVKDSYFKHIAFEKKVAIDENAIKLNYAHFSPYKKSEIVSLSKETNLLLWFYEQSVENKLVIPEGYLLYNYLKKRYDNHIIIIDTEPAVVLVLKEAMLVSQSVKKGADDRYSKALQREFSLDKAVHISAHEYGHIMNRAVLDVEYQDFLHFSNFSFDKRKIEKVVNAAAMPFLVLIGMMVVLETVQSFYIGYQTDSQSKVYRELKEKNQKVRTQYDKVEEKIEAYKTFIETEQHFNTKFYIAAKLSSYLQEYNSTIRYIEFTGSAASVTIKTARQNELVSALLKSGILENLKLGAIHKDSKTGMDQVTFTANIVPPQRAAHEQ